MNLRISPFFFLTAMIIGYINSRTPIGTFLWTFVIFVSVLFHEFGHAFMGFIFGQKPRIELTAFGGLTYPDGPKLSLWKEFLVILAGPLFGFSLFVASYYLLMLPISNPYLIYILQALKLINFFWTLINLLPVLPLDGGQLVRVILQGFFGIKAWRYTYLVSTVLALILALGFFALGAYFVGAIFFLFAYQGFDAFKNARNMTEADNESDPREELKGIEALLYKKDVEEAREKLEHLHETTKNGIIHTFATEYLAKMYFEKDQMQKAYDLLKPEKEKITDEAKYILHVSAFEVADYPLCLELSVVCFQSLQLVDIAVRASLASAMIKDVYSAIKWLETAEAYGAYNVKEIVQNTMFDQIRNEAPFVEFMKFSKP